MRERWLVPHDFSPQARAAAELAAEEAAAVGARLVVVHAVPRGRTLRGEGWFDAGAERRDSDAGSEASGDSAHETLEREARALRAEHAGLHVETRLEQGPPDEAVPSVAEELDASRIVVGSHGRRGVQRWVLGSVAEALVRGAGVPVLVVKPDEERDVGT